MQTGELLITAKLLSVIDEWGDFKLSFFNLMLLHDANAIVRNCEAVAGNCSRETSGVEDEAGRETGCRPFGRPKCLAPGPKQVPSPNSLPTTPKAAETRRAAQVLVDKGSFFLAGCVLIRVCGPNLLLVSRLERGSACPILTL
jgi:hypothetical protein